MYNTNFDKVLAEAERVFELHRENKGETWKELPIDALANGVKEEFDEWFVKYKETLKGLRDNKKQIAKEAEEDQFYELMDLVNSSLMYAERLRQKIARRKKTLSPDLTP